MVGPPCFVFGERLLVRRVRAGEGSTSFDLVQHKPFELLLVGGGLGDLGGEVTRDNDDPFLVADNDVARKNWYPSTSDRHVDIDGVVDDQIEIGRATGGENGKGIQRDLRRVADRAIADQTGSAADAQPGNQDVAAGGATQIAPAIHHQDLAGPDHFDGFALRMVRVAETFQPVQILPHRDIAQRDGFTDEPAMGWVERRQAIEEEITQTALEQLGRNRRGARLSQRLDDLSWDWQLLMHPPLLSSRYHPGPGPQHTKQPQCCHHEVSNNRGGRTPREIDSDRDDSSGRTPDALLRSPPHRHEYAAPLLLGEDPFQIDRHWRTIYENAARCGAKGVEVRALSAIDVALWDILGQAAGLPIFQLLGGASHDRVPIYNTCVGPIYARSLDRSDGIGRAGVYEDLDAFMTRADELANDLLAEGIRGMKIWPFDPFAAATRGQRIGLDDLDRGLEPFRKIRHATGNAMEIMIEGHGLWSLPAARRIAHAVEEFEPLWIEDLMRPENVDALADLRRTTRVPVLASEMLMTRSEYLPVFERQAADIVMIDPVWCGGISEARKIGHMAEVYQRPVTFHDCAGPINLFTGLHLAFNAPNTIYQETVRAFIRTFYDDLVTTNVAIEDGHALPPLGPGLGTALLPDVLQRPDATVIRSSA